MEIRKNKPYYEYIIRLHEDQRDQMVAESLKEAYRLNSIPYKIDCSDDEIEIDEEFLKAIDLVMQYFCDAEQIKQWNEEKKEEGI